jgi:hypothetical protein
MRCRTKICACAARILTHGTQYRLGMPEERPHRQHQQEGRPHRLAHRSADIAHAVGSSAPLAGDHRRCRGHQAHAEDQAEDIQVHAQRRGRQRVRAHPAEQHDVGGMDERLGQVGQDHGRGERQGGLCLGPPGR